MAHLGNTVVNGALRVLGGEYVDTINGVTVGNSPKFTDTTYTAATAAPGNIASSGSAGSSTNYARQDHTHKITVGTGDSDGQVKIAGQNASVKNCALKSDITTLQTNFQAGVDSVYNAVVAKGSTPASKSLSDVVAGISAIPNSNSGTYAITSNGVKDMGAANTYRYANVNVPNSNSGTYTPAGNAIYDMGATNNKRYCDGRTAYSAGYAAKRSELTATYKPTSRATGLDMGSNHTYRYVNTTSVPNTNSGTYAVTSNGVKDMGADNTQRYVNVSVPNSNSGTQTITANGTTDMGATNDKRYVSVNVANSNSGTYTFAENDTGGIKDMGATNDKRYVVATNVYNKGKADGKADHSGTYKPTTRASNCDMGSVHSYRYVNTTEVPNSNSGTYSITSNGIKDMTATNTYRYANVNVPNTNSGTYAVTSNGIKDMGSNNAQRYVNVNVPNSNSGTASYDSNGIKDMGATNSYRYVNINVPHPTHTTTYTPTSRASNCDMGSVHSYRYVDTRSVPNSNSGTYTPAGNAIYDMGATNDKRYCDGRTAYTAGYDAKKATLTETYTPTTKATYDLGEDHTYRYVDTRSVANTSSGTYSTTFSSNGTKDLGTSFAYRYIKISVANSNSGTYTPTTKSTFDMGAANNKRYVDTRSVANVNSGTYNALGNKVYDMGADNAYRYCDATSAYQAGWDAQNLSFIGSYRIQGKGNRSVTMSTLSPGRYLIVTKSVPNIVDWGWSGACTYSLSTGTVEKVLVHENKGGSGQYYWAYWIAIVKLTKTTPTNSVTVTHKYETTVTSTISMSVFKLG